MKQKLIDGFNKVFGDESKNSAADLRVFFAPGRVNLIGEHIDYNGGLVFPCALDIGTYVAVRRRDDDVIRLASADFEPLVTVAVDNLAFNPDHGWANYPKGVAFCLGEMGNRLTGFDMYFLGDLPNGAGLSSSASVSVATATALNGIFNLGIEPVELAKLCPKAEAYSGVNCGIMDPFASAMGKKDHAFLLNCTTMEYSYVPLNLGDYRIVIVNTNKRRGLADSKYNERQGECKQALADLQKVCNITALCDLTPEEFETHKSAIGEEIPRMRASHAIHENHRTKAAAKFAENFTTHPSYMNEFALAMNHSHDSLAKMYEVSCHELDVLVNAANSFHESSSSHPVMGSRMTGAGFGGCTVNIVHKDHIEAFSKYVGDTYQRETGLTASFYTAQPGDGAREI